MASSDYYEVLGLTKSATADEIRKAYRKLSRTYHPDVKKDDPAAAKRFQEIQEAHEVLGDEEKRRKYDRFGPDFAQMDKMGGRGIRMASPGRVADTDPGPADSTFRISSVASTWETCSAAAGAARAVPVEPLQRARTFAPR